jgi:hypothetical protein
MKLQNTFYYVLVSSLISCSGNHYHDGIYKTHFYIYDVTVKIEGEDVETNNSVTGIKKMKCKQYKDRIEYEEGNGVTTVLTVLEDGSLKENELLTFTKVKN